MQTRFFCAFALLTISASASATSFRDDSRYVTRGPRTGYYIVQGPPNDFYMRRIGSFIRGRTTSHDVESFFGRPKQIEKRRDGFIAYYTIEVYNPFEENSGGRR